MSEIIENIDLHKMGIEKDIPYQQKNRMVDPIKRDVGIEDIKTRLGMPYTCLIVDVI